MNYIVLASLTMSIAGLFLIYIISIGMEIEIVKMGDITDESIGKTISAEGKIKQKRSHDKGHMFLTITDGSTDLQVPIFSNMMKYMNEHEFKEGRSLKVTGYSGQIQEQFADHT